MRTGTSRRVVGALVTGACLAASLMTTASTAAAGSYSALVADVGLVRPQAMVQAGDKLFISDGNAVRVLTEQGVAITSVPGIFGAKGLVVSADGATVYAAAHGSNVIAAIDVAAPAVTTTYTVGGCPSDLAVVGSALFYSFGCTDGQGMLGHVDLTTGTVANPATPDATGFYGPPRVTGAEGRLYAVDVASSPADLTMWPVTDTTLGTPVVSTGWSVSDIVAHGDRLLVASPSAGAFTVLDSTLSTVATYPAEPYPATGAWTSDGAHIVGGLAATYGSGFYVYDTASGSTVLKAGIPGLAQVSGFPEVQPRGLALSADDSTAFALAHQYDNDGDHYYLATTTTRTPLASSVSVTATTPARYGLPSTITVRTPGRPGAVVTLSVTADGATRTRSLVTNVSGVAVTTWVSAFTATVRATASGDLTHESATSSAVAFRVPSVMSVAVARGYKTSGGVTYFRKASAAQTAVRVAPYAYGRSVSVTLQRKSGTRWVSIQRTTLRLNTLGITGTYMKLVTKGVVYRVAYSFRGDAFNGPSSGVSRPYTVK